MPSVWAIDCYLCCTYLSASGFSQKLRLNPSVWVGEYFSQNGTAVLFRELTIFILFTGALLGCSKPFAPKFGGENSSLSSTSTSLQVIGGDKASLDRFAKAKGILDRYCVECHFSGNSLGIKDYSSNREIDFVNQGLVVPANLHKSLLASRVQGFPGKALDGKPASMPTNATLPKQHFDVLAAWIVGMKPVDNLGGSQSRSNRILFLTRSMVLNTLKNSFGIENVRFTYAENSHGEIPYSIAQGQNNSVINFPEYFQFTQDVTKEHLSKFLTCQTNALNDQCLDASIAKTGKKFFRRNLTAAEVTSFRALAKSQGQANVVQGFQYVVVAMMNSVHFLYQSFKGIGSARLNGPQLATRIGFVILGGNPDEALIDAGIRWGTNPPIDGVAAEVERLLRNRPLAAALFVRFLMEHWDLRIELSNTASYFKEDTQRLAPFLRQEFSMAATDIFLSTNGDWRRLLDHKKTYVNLELAKHYGYTTLPKDNATWIAVDQAPQRAGVLSTGLVLASHSGDKYSSTTFRGVFVVSRFLCQNIPSQPDNIDQLIASSGVELKETDTVSQRIKTLGTKQPCASCHVYMDPYGKLFENFDWFGRYLTVRHNAPVDSVSQIGSETVSSPKELADYLLKREEALFGCFLKGLGYYAGVSANKITELSAGQIAAQERFNFDSLIKRVILSDGFLSALP